jgi:metallo-beta-lactamase family protein
MSASPRPSLTFLGGVGTVTGSKFLVESATAGVLIDCGLFQGLSSLRRRNWERPALRLDELSAVVLTHAHLDHTGYLPALAKAGWDGPVYCTEATALLANIVLTDSAHLMQEEARLANEQGWSKHHPALPLYAPEDVERVRALFRHVPFGAETDIAPGVQLTLGRAGHILGSSWARLDVTTDGRSHSVLSSGDLGRPSHPLLVPPDPRPEVGTLLLESTYGDRGHGTEDPLVRLSDVINRTTARGGSVLIPAFAVDRTEILLHDLVLARKQGRIRDLPIVVDSPMALSCLKVYRRAVEERWPDIRPDITDYDSLDPAHLLEVTTAEESARWNDPRQPAILISASGMASGGRVLHHLRHMLPNRRHTVLIAGYAAEGTRARQLGDGASEVKIHGRYVPVRAEVVVIDAFSAHADAEELAAWATAAPAPQTCYVIHGEQHSAQALAAQLRRDAEWTTVVPRSGERVLL